MRTSHCSMLFVLLISTSIIAIAQPRIRYDPAGSPVVGQGAGVPIAQAAAQAVATGQPGTRLLWDLWGHNVGIVWSGDAASDSFELRRFISAMLAKVDNPAGEWRPQLRFDWQWVCSPKLNDVDYAATLVEWTQRRGYWYGNHPGRIAAFSPSQIATIQSLAGPPTAWRTARLSAVAILAFEGDPGGFALAWIASARQALANDEPSATAEERRALYPSMREQLDWLEKIASVANSPDRLLKESQTLTGILTPAACGTWAINRSIALGTPKATVSSEIIKWLDEEWSKADKNAYQMITRNKLIAIDNGWISPTDLPKIPSVSHDIPECGGH